MLYKNERVRAEFHGNREIKTHLNYTGPEAVILFKAELRAICLAIDYEIQRIYKVEFMVTDVLRTWAEQDGIYKKQVDRFGIGYQSGKIISPHQCGRGCDMVPALLPQATEAESVKLKIAVYTHAVEYLNTRFPYCWNAPQRLLRKGELVLSNYKTAIVHDVGRGKHLHTQFSWGKFIK